MNRKKKKLLIFLCAVAAVLLLRQIWIRMPSEGTLIFKNEASSISIDEPLSEEEVAAVKRILWGKIRWPEWLSGYPACGFGRNYAIILDGTRYMLAWDSCGTLCAKDAASEEGANTFINISDREKAELEALFSIRGVR